MSDVLYLAWRYLIFHRAKTVILVVSMALIVLIPAALQVLVRQGQEQLTGRAEETPLLLGAKGSPLELTLNSLYFSREEPETLDFAEVSAIEGTQLAEAVPIYVRFRTREDPIVGTTLDYFTFRDLRIVDGRMMGLLGDCVLGAGVARRRELGPGDAILSSPESTFGLADGYPLKMRISGVLAASASPDDDAVFVDVKTAWVIQGLGHGHDDLASVKASASVLKREGQSITANASVRQYQEITDANRDSFHFHGDISAFPITAVLARAPDHKAKTLLLGRYQSSETLQLVEPAKVIEKLLATVFTIQNLVLAALAVVGTVTLLLIVMVFLLSLRQRQQEIATMFKIGGSRSRIAAIVSTEIGIVLVSGLLIAAGLTWLTIMFAPTFVREYLMS
jgi:putative ABC transport system permease protein